MQKRSLSICVIGTGPTALTAVKKLEGLNVRISIIDCSKMNNKGYSHKKKLIVKNRNEKSWVYEAGSPIQHEKNPKLNVLESGSKGGLSNIWGGVFFPQLFEKEVIPPYSFKTNKEFEEFCDIKLCMDFKKLNLKEFRTEKLREDINITYFKPPIAKEKKIPTTWSSFDKWTKIKGKINYIYGVANSIKRHGKYTSVEIESNHKKFNKSFDHVFLACGPVGNAKIICNSINERIEVLDSSTYYLFSLGYAKKYNVKEKMWPYQAGYIIKNKKIICYFQNYQVAQEMIDSFKYHKILRCLIKILKNIKIEIRVSMIFLNSINSEKISILRKEAKLLLDTSKGIPTKKLLIYRNISNFMRKSGYFSLPIFIKTKTGEGAHQAGTFIKGHQESYLDKFNGLTNTHLLGMSQLETLYGGPVTYSGMFKTYIYMSKFIKDRL